MSGRIVGELYLPDVTGDKFLADVAQRTSLGTFTTNVGVSLANTQANL